MAWLTLFAILLSPVIAVLVTMWIQKRIERRGVKLRILAQLMGNRHTPIAPENIVALNMIDLVFHDDERVRGLWSDYFDMLCNKGLDNELGWEQRNKKRNELITAVASSLGYSEQIDHLDVDRIYKPQGLGDRELDSQKLMEELLRVLTNTDSLAMRKRKPTGAHGADRA